MTRYQRGAGRWQRVHRAYCLAGRFGLLSVCGAGENQVAGSENRFLSDLDDALGSNEHPPGTPHVSNRTAAP